jgi:general secretion pathway protein C
LAAWVAALLWAGVMLSVAFWALRWWGSAPLTVVDGLPGTAPAAEVSAVALALGTGVAAAPLPEAAVTPVSNRLRLIGVVAHRDRWGAALIAVGEQAPRPFTVGSEVEPGWYLQSVDRRSARLAQTAAGSAPLVLEMPTPPDGT